MTKTIKIKKLKIRISLRNKWDKYQKQNYSSFNYKLCIWFKMPKCMGKKTKRDKKNNLDIKLVNSYMLGIDLIFFWGWIDITYNAM